MRLRHTEMSCCVPMQELALLDPALPTLAHEIVKIAIPVMRLVKDGSVEGVCYLERFEVEFAAELPETPVDWEDGNNSDGSRYENASEEMRFCLVSFAIKSTFQSGK